jgi:hypothetical protein
LEVIVQSTWDELVELSMFSFPCRSLSFQNRIAPLG